MTPISNYASHSHAAPARARIGGRSFMHPDGNRGLPAADVAFQ
jgi:hypothetical protein